MSKIRVFFENIIANKSEIVLSKSQSHYLVNVMRKNVGDKILIFNEKDGEWLSEIKSKKKEVILNILNQTKKPEERQSDDIWVCFGIVKSKNINYLIEKITEIGIKKIIPMKTQFSENFKLNYVRLNKIIIEAVEQSGGIELPKIINIKLFKDLLIKWDEERTIIVCDEREKDKMISSIIKEDISKKIAIFIGPIGGWSDSEIEQLKRRKNIFFVSLGDKILKADTAAIYALSCIKSSEKNYE